MSCSFTTTWSLSAALLLFNGRRGGHPTTGQPRRPPFSVDLKLRLFFSFVRFDRSLSNNSLTIFSFVVLFTLLSLLPLFLVTGTRSDRRCRRHPVISSCVCLSLFYSLPFSCSGLFDEPHKHSTAIVSCSTANRTGSSDFWPGRRGDESAALTSASSGHLSIHSLHRGAAGAAGATAARPTEKIGEREWIEQQQQQQPTLERVTLLPQADPTVYSWTS